MKSSEQDLQTRLSERKPVIWLAESAFVPPEGVRELTIDCTHPWDSQGPLYRAYQKVKSWLGEEQATTHGTSRTKEGGLRYQLLGEMPVTLIEHVFVQACNRLAQTDQQVFLCFRGAERAAPQVLSILQELLAGEPALALPWLLPLRQAPTGELKALVETLRTKHGDACLLQPDVDTQEDTPDESPAFDWSSLPGQSLRVLRAGAVIGSIFEARLVAALLSLSVSEVLELLQQAFDAGAPFEDDGSKRFFLTKHDAQTLRSGLLPSLSGHWHERIASLLSSPPPSYAPFPPEPTNAEAHASRETPHTLELTAPPPPEDEITRAQTPVSVSELVDQREDKPETADAIDASDAVRTTTQANDPYDASQYADLYAPGESEWFSSQEHAQEPDPAPAQASAPDAAARRQVPEARAEEELGERLLRLAQLAHKQREAREAQKEREALEEARQAQARAAAHLHAAGRTPAAIEQYLQAVEEATATGNTRQGLAVAQQAIELLSQLPPSRQHALYESQLLLAIGRLQWHGAISGAAFPLQEALASIDAALQSLPQNPPPALLGQLAATRAGICYDLGDFSSLKHALQDLTHVSRQLLSSQEPLLAARLLNDQAALYIRLGDPLQATQLLYRSRDLFQNMLRENPKHPTAREELADTHHLLARLPLHAPIQNGREFDAYTISLDHAAMAQELYEVLQQPRELARVWETIGRLQIGRKRHQEATEALLAALELQQKLGDITGLARTTAALADLFIAQHKPQQAAGLLQQSISLNLEKGSHIGISFNQKTLQTLLEHTSNADLTEPLLHTIRHIQSLLQQAQTILGIQNQED